jgi:hypothetical protein
MKKVPAAVSKPKKRAIPKKVKQEVWKSYIGAEKGIALCTCCETTQIAQMDFHCGHVISEAHGGTITVKNLRPICASCNASMGTTDYDTFKLKMKGAAKPDDIGKINYDYYIGEVHDIDKVFFGDKSVANQIANAQLANVIYERDASGVKLDRWSQRIIDYEKMKQQETRLEITHDINLEATKYTKKGSVLYPICSSASPQFIMNAFENIMRCKHPLNHRDYSIKTLTDGTNCIYVVIIN